MSKIKTLNAKRLVAVFTAMLITVLSLSYTNNNVNAINSSITYFVYDAKTAEKIPNRNYVLSKLSSSNNPRTVIGDEDREIDWTKSGVVKLMSSNYYLGSGFVVSDHVIATAAHCVYGKKISEILLFDNNGGVTLQATPVEYHVPYVFTRPTNNYEPYNYNYDYALITVQEDLSAYACFDLGVPLDTFTNKHSTISVTGFPERIIENDTEVQVNTHSQHTMYTGNGTFLGMNSYKVSYDADVTSGNSGGPAYITESLPNRTYYTVFAINTYSGVTENGGVRITTDLIHFYTGNNTNINW